MPFDAGDFWDKFWGGFFKHARAIGLNRRAIKLLIITALAYWALVNKAPPFAVILLFVLAYGADPFFKFMKARRIRHNRSIALDEQRGKHKHYVSRKRRQLQADAPELPIEWPRDDDDEVKADD